ncbi:MAG: hypothetical protein JW974_00785 [Alphaproteobacteria bacterium]|nr:hypothetical protein [Alphaproteobacteria bacterium]MBN2674981.1 hypothetical protein [Alphaproteobacteria bacterium]
MKNISSFFGIVFLIFGLSIGGANAYQLLSSKELGQKDAKNQNVVVKCTTDTGKISTQTCTMRRYAKCSGAGIDKKCNGWQAWKDLRNPSSGYSDWRSGAAACCKSKGLR